MRVEVGAPEIAGDSVVFRWTQSEPNPYQSANAFHFRYEGIDLARFSVSLFHEIFLALQLRVFAAYAVPVELVFGEPVAEWSFAFWQAYHRADLVTVAPAFAGAYAPWVGPADPAQPAQFPGSAAVFYGGGKDSIAATCLLSEVYGPENVVLVQYVAPLRRNRELADRLERRQEALMLQPARELLGVRTQRVWSDYQANFVRSAGQCRPHVEFFTVGALPALLAQRVSLAAFSREWPDYATIPQPDGSFHFRLAASRPETIATQTTHYRATLGLDLAITNLNLLLTPWTGFRLVAERYPHALDIMTSCTLGEVDQRWCYQCRKCVMHGLYGLIVRRLDPRFDYDRVFSQAGFMKAVVRYAESGVDLSEDGNALWSEFLQVRPMFQPFCHVIAKVDPDVVADLVGPEAYGNLLTLKALYGNRLFPQVEVMPTSATSRLGFADARAFAAIVAEHIPSDDEMLGPYFNDASPIEFGFDRVMPTRTGLLPHIQEASLGTSEGALREAVAR